MARKQKQSMSYIPEVIGEEWLALWSARVNYTPPPVAPRGQGLRKVEGVLCDPTQFTSLGPSTKTVKKRAAGSASRY